MSIQTPLPIVEVSRAEYEKLIRENERLAAIKRIIERPNAYISLNDLKSILDIEVPEEQVM